MINLVHLCLTCYGWADPLGPRRTLCCGEHSHGPEQSYAQTDKGRGKLCNQKTVLANAPKHSILFSLFISNSHLNSLLVFLGSTDITQYFTLIHIKSGAMLLNCYYDNQQWLLLEK